MRLRSVEPMTDPRAVSFWLDSLPADHSLRPRQQLPGDVTADVAIVGAGYTGLWTAYYLQADRPEPADRGGRGRVRRLRRQRSQWWLAVGAAADELREDGRAARSRRRGRDAADDARRRRRGRPGRPRRRASTATWPRAATSTWPATTPQVERVARAAEVLPLVGLRRGGLPLADRRRGVGAPQRHQGARRRLHAALRGDSSGSAGPRAGRDRRERRRRRSTRRPACSSSATARCAARPARCSADVVVRATEGFTAALPGPCVAPSPRSTR